MRDEIYYNAIADDMVETYCLRINLPEEEERVKMVPIPIQNYRSDHDVILHQHKSFKNGYSIDSF